ATPAASCRARRRVVSLSSVMGVPPAGSLGTALAGSAPSGARQACIRRSLLAAQIVGADADLDDARLVDAGHGDVLEPAVVGLALARLLDDNVLGAGDQRPEGRCLRVLGGIGAEGEIDPGVVEVGVAR